MNKTKSILAFASVAFLFGCSADGIFYAGSPGSVKWSKDYKSSPSSGGDSSSSGGETGNGYCLISGQCFNMEEYGLTSAMCTTAASGTVYPSLSSCESATGSNTNGTWCVDHNYQECTNDVYYTLSDSNCAEWLGVLESSCPAGYDR